MLPLLANERAILGFLFKQCLLYFIMKRYRVALSHCEIGSVSIPAKSNGLGAIRVGLGVRSLMTIFLTCFLLEFTIPEQS